MAHWMAHRSYGHKRHTALRWVVLEQSGEPFPTVKWIFIDSLFASHRQEHHMASGHVCKTKQQEPSRAL